MDVSRLDQLVQQYLHQALAPATQRSYVCGQRRYLQFCNAAGCSPYPVSENGLCRFVAHLADGNLKHQTIKLYLSANRFGQIVAGHGDPFISSMPILEYLLRGIKYNQAKQCPESRRIKMPVTPKILLQMRAVLAKSAREPDNIMLWAACAMCFFGFLRSGEISTPSSSKYDSTVHLMVEDVQVDSREHPSVVRVQIKASKTDPFRKGVLLYLGRTDNLLCPVAAITAYLASRGSEPGPFFRFEKGGYLTRESFVKRVRAVMLEAGLEAQRYSGHSFRVGAATTAAARGVEDSLIKTLGRWNSSAYLLYIRVPQERLAAVSAVLSQTSD